MKCKDGLEYMINFQHTCFTISSQHITFGIHDIETLILIHIDMSICMSCSNHLRGFICWRMRSFVTSTKGQTSNMRCSYERFTFSDGKNFCFRKLIEVFCLLREPFYGTICLYHRERRE